jgi:hypothetical protein
MNAEASESVLVVVEREAACLLWMTHWGPLPDDDWSMLEQEEWEPAQDFAARLESTLDRHTADEGSRHVVLLVASGDNDEASTSARWAMASTILTHLVRTGGGKLLLTRGYGFDGRQQAALADLADELMEAWDGSNVVVGTQFHEPPPESQVQRPIASLRRAHAGGGQAIAQPA